MAPDLTPGSLVDVHAHFVTDAYLAAARDAGLIHPDGMAAWASWSAEEHLALMDEHRIATAFLSVSSPGTHFGQADATARRVTREANEFAAEVAERHPGRFGQFASLPLPDVEGALAETAYALDVLHADGVAVESNAEGRYLGDPAFEPLWAELNARGAVVFLHPTSPCGADHIAIGRPRPMLEFPFETTRTASDLIFNGVLRRFPAIQWIFPHGGGALPLLADRMELCRRIFGYDLDGPTLQEQLSRVWFDMAGTPFPRQIPTLTDLVGTDRILYGSDYCWTPPHIVATQVDDVDQAPAPAGASSWRELTTRNATRLLPRLLG
ncbi:amidohydrolase family protein [Streptomyces sparsogenes]|uniref:6-methylsalicylate decarboxylase n=1 Tax=Streptomyces sparsogenes DSM 40356 TaxID=1331668 RepID=A0A1R1SEV7_9ACTN|nr:amidohydrolase family protein [Streptomyces sparsogenes]OMI36783.1 hydrolase [Streptomyces sparsogenes DSM 40356]